MDRHILYLLAAEWGSAAFKAFLDKVFEELVVGGPSPDVGAATSVEAVEPIH